MGSHVEKRSDAKQQLQECLDVMSEELRNAHTERPERGYAIARQLERLRKRAKLGSPGLDIKAIEGFKMVNARVGSLVPVLDPFVEHNARLFILEAFERYNSRWDTELIQISYDYRHVFNMWRFGPGASNGVQGTHMAEKIYQPMSCTAPARPLVSHLRYTNAYFSSYDNGTSNGIVDVYGSRLTTTPKNETTDRTIAIEPSGNMALQLGAGGYITEVLRSIGLDIMHQQDLNKVLAWIGSLTDEIVTIDMTSASDMFHRIVVRKLLPEGLYDLMMRIRSPVTQLPGKGKERLQLEMMSTMGNGFTFPMMTLIFVALIYAVRLERGGPSRFIDWRRTGVFGDDLIVPKAEAPRLIEVLEGCGFIVNSEKSYLSGPFRESCGGDFWNGYDVTPVYIKELSSDSHVYAALNGVFEWCAKTGVLLHRTLAFLKSCIRGEFMLVPEWHGNDAGFRTPQVGNRRYKHLRPSHQSRRTETNGHFAMMLACGGYVDSHNLDDFMLFVPRPRRQKYVVKKARLPKGWLDGRDVFTRQDHISDYIRAHSFLLA